MARLLRKKYAVPVSLQKGCQGRLVITLFSFYASEYPLAAYGKRAGSSALCTPAAKREYDTAMVSGFMPVSGATGRFPWPVKHRPYVRSLQEKRDYLFPDSPSIRILI